MGNIAVVYWSGTGNTQAMAEAIAQACNGVLIEAGDFSPDQVASYDAIAFGCPSMGTEQLEESVFAPLFEACKPLLQGKKLALFGSYGWGDGEWMRTWEAECLDAGATLACKSVICQEAPDAGTLEQCAALAQALM